MLPGSIALRRKTPHFRYSSHHCCILRSHDPHVTTSDTHYMRHALRLAAKGIGKTFPNPVVGCVIVKDNQIIGEGYHPQSGKPHAEIYALRAAGQKAVGATAYVTLEPCDHFGRTPPCSQALLDAKISKVVVGVVDPNCLVEGKGIKRLKNAGVEVVIGCLEEECFEINKDFMERMQQ